MNDEVENDIPTWMIFLCAGILLGFWQLITWAVCGG